MAIPDDLKKLTPVKKGDPARLAAASWRINALQNLLRSLIRGDNIVSSPGGNIRKRVIEGVGFTLSTERGNGVRGQETLDEIPLSPHSYNDEDGDGIRITPGTIAGLVPAPEGPGDNVWLIQPLPDTATALWWIWADIEITSPLTIGLPVSVSWDTGSTVPVNTSDFVHLPIGTFATQLDSESNVVLFGDPQRNLQGSQDLLLLWDGTTLQPYWFPI